MDLPQVKVEENKEIYIDLFSWLSKEGSLVVNKEIDARVSSILMSTLLFIRSDYAASKSITIYLFNKTADIVSALCIIDLIESMKKEGYIFHTFGFGEIDLGTALIIKSGSKGKRTITQNSIINLHLGDKLNFKSIYDQNKNSISRESKKIRSKILSKLTTIPIDESKVNTNDDSQSTEKIEIEQIDESLISSLILKEEFITSEKAKDIHITDIII